MKDLTKFFIGEMYSKPPMRNYSTNKVIFNHIDEIWNIDLTDFSEYKVSNNKRYRFIFVIINIFSNYTWANPLKIKNSQTLTYDFSILLIKSKRRPLKKKKKAEQNCTILFFKSFQKVKRYSNIQDSQIKDPLLLNE